MKTRHPTPMAVGAAVILLLLVPSTRAVGDAIVVLEQGDAQHNVPAALIRVEPSSGAQDVISSGDLLSNAIGENPNGFVYDPYDKRFLVVDRLGRVIAVTAAKRTQSIVAQGLGDPTAIAVEGPDRLIIADFGGSLLRFDAHSETASALASGGLIGGVAPSAVQVASDGTIIVSSLTFGGNDVPGPPSRVIAVDPNSGDQSLIAEITDGQFRDFALTPTEAFIAISSRGGPSGQDTVAKLDLVTGQLTPIVTGLQRVLDVDFATDGSLILLDQILSLPCCPPWIPAVYQTTMTGGSLSLLAQGGHIFVPARAVVLPGTCGDRIVDVVEQCDDGNTVSGDGCSETCQREGSGADGCAIGAPGSGIVPWLVAPLVILLGARRRKG